MLRTLLKIAAKFYIQMLAMQHTGRCSISRNKVTSTLRLSNYDSCVAPPPQNECAAMRSRGKEETNLWLPSLIPLHWGMWIPRQTSTHVDFFVGTTLTQLSLFSAPKTDKIFGASSSNMATPLSLLPATTFICCLQSLLTFALHRYVEVFDASLQQTCLLLSLSHRPWQRLFATWVNVAALLGVSRFLGPWKSLTHFVSTASVALFLSRRPWQPLFVTQGPWKPLLSRLL